MVEIRDDPAGVRMGKIDFGGIRKDVCLAYLPDLEIGDYAIVHVGFAITKLDEASARESLRMFRELGLLEEELGLAGSESGLPPSCPLPGFRSPGAG